MSNKIILFIFFISCSLSLCAQTNTVNTDLLGSFPDGTEIAIGIYEYGEIKKYGYTVLDNQLVTSHNAGKLFEIGSITKVFTTLSAMQVLNRNEIDIDSAVVTMLPKRNISDKLSFRKLMTHTAGFPKMPANFVWSALRSPSDPFLHYSEEMMYRFLGGYEPKEEESFQYSNLSMGLLGHSLAQMESKSLASIMEDEIFVPLQMSSTSLGLVENRYQKVINPIGSNGEPKSTWKFSEVTKGAGNGFSNIDDMSLFLAFLLDKKNASNELYKMILEMEREQLVISDKESMGLGWRIHKNELQIPYHGGRTYGFKSLIAYHRESEKGIVVLTNEKGLSRKYLMILKEVCYQFLEEDS